MDISPKKMYEANKHKKCSKACIISRMQGKTTTRFYYYTPNRMQT